jgi:hypothetical protein
MRPRTSSDAPPEGCRRKAKAVAIRPLSRQRILMHSDSLDSLAPVAPPPNSPVARRRVMAYAVTPEHSSRSGTGSGSLRPGTSPNRSQVHSRQTHSRQRPGSRADGPGGQGNTFLTGFGLEAEPSHGEMSAVSLLTERDNDEESVEALDAQGFPISTLQASKYFGQQARANFFSQCNFLNKQRSLAALPSLDAPASSAPCFTAETSSVGTGGGGVDELLDDDEFDAMTLPTTWEALEEDIGEPTSPRSNYIFDCLADRLNPRASLIIRKTAITSLNLRHLGMGDKMAGHLAKAIGEIPCLMTVDISDNGLTDEGLKPMLAAILSIKTLTELNVSQNEVGGEAAEALALYVENPACPLQRLIMQRADVDDFEGERFVTGLVNIYIY